MSLEKVAILSPGDMGHAVGRVLGEHGLDVMTCLEGRSAHTRALAERGGIRELPSLEALLGEADLVMSILPPVSAQDLAKEVAGAMRASGHTPPYADCNAVSPATTRGIEEIITAAGADFIDGGIIGPPPGRGQPTRFYVSGSRSGLMSGLDGKGIVVKPIGTAVGDASAIKMCYASLTKGTRALQAAVITAAEAYGLTEELRDELLYSQKATFEHMQKNQPRLPSVSGRWVGEMEEIAATFEAAGVTPYFHKGAAEMLRLLAATPLAGETADTIDENRTLEEAARIYAEQLKKK